MRNIINISLPEKMAKEIRKEVKKGNFASTSEYFRYLVRTQRLSERLEKSQQEIKDGKGKVLKSLKNLH